MALILSPPLRWRFTDPDDVAAYGDRWWPWEERVIARLPALDLIALEDAIDIPVPAVIKGLRSSATMATLAAMWISMHREGHPVGWAGFNPLVLAAEWEQAPVAPFASGEDPTPDSGSSIEPSPESVSS